jgi:hypothetical protein
LEVPGGARRLDRIVDLIRESLSDLAGPGAYVHDLRIIYEGLRAPVSEIVDRTAAKSVFEARAFR